MYFRQQVLSPDTPAGPCNVADSSAKLRNVRAESKPSFKYVDLFAGIGGFHSMLDHAGGQCVYVSEIDSEARETYLRNWVDVLPEDRQPKINMDITSDTPDRGPIGVPEHEVLAAGFPCQPFSKSGHQRGMDEARGTLFWNIARVLQVRKPKVVLLENVRNIAGPRHRHEWDVIISTLRSLGYRVSEVPTVFSPHFLPPSLGGTPQVRDRVFILGTYVGKRRAEAAMHVPPTVTRGPVEGWDPSSWSAEWVLDDDATIEHVERYRLNSDEVAWIDAWDDLVQRMYHEKGLRLPGFPLWADDWKPERSLAVEYLDRLPSWKRNFLIKNAQFYDEHRGLINSWRKAHPEFRGFPESRRASSGRRKTPRRCGTRSCTSGHPGSAPRHRPTTRPSSRSRRPPSWGPGGAGSRPMRRPGSRACLVRSPSTASATRRHTSRSATGSPSELRGMCSVSMSSGMPMTSPRRSSTLCGERTRTRSRTR